MGGINTFVELHENKRDYIDSFPGVYNMALLTDVISLDEETIYFAEAWYPTDDTLYAVTTLDSKGSVIKEFDTKIIDDPTRPTLPSIDFLTDEGELYLHIAGHFLSDRDGFAHATKLPQLGKSALRVTMKDGLFWMLEGSFQERTILRSVNLAGEVVSTTDLSADDTYPVTLVFDDMDNDIWVYANAVPGLETFHIVVTGVAMETPTSTQAACAKGFWGSECNEECASCPSPGICRDGIFGDGDCDCGVDGYGSTCSPCRCPDERGTCDSGKKGSGVCFACEFGYHGILCESICDCGSGETCVNAASNQTSGCMAHGMAMVVHGDENTRNPLLILGIFLLICLLIGVCMLYIREACTRNSNGYDQLNDQFIPEDPDVEQRLLEREREERLRAEEERRREEEENLGNTISGCTETMPCLTFNHGSGQGNGVAMFLAEYTKTLPTTPHGVVVIEAHVEADPVEIVGDPDLAARTAALLQQNDIGVRMHQNQTKTMGHGASDAKRAFHQLGLPFVTISLRTGQDAAEHLAMGVALAPLRREGILLLGSGVSTFHNFHIMFSQSQAAKDAAADECSKFDAWLVAAIESDPEERKRQFLDWQQAPGAGVMHPPGEAEHFMPTLVIVGAAQNEKGRAVGDSSHKLILPKLSQKFAFRHFDFRR